MAKKPEARLAKFLKTISGTFVSQKTLQRTTLNTDGNTSFSTSEKAAIVARLSTITSANTDSNGYNSYKNYIMPLAKQISQLKLDNETLRVLAPEIKTAETIVIPSIMSPTDLRDGAITLLSTSTMVSDDSNRRISELLNDHFNNSLGLSTKLIEWIKEALYGAGSKPILVLPITELDSIVNDPAAVQYTTTQMQYSTESLKKQTKIPDMAALEAISVFDVSDTKQKNSANKISSAVEAMKSDLESTITDFMKKLPETKRTQGSYNFQDKFKGEALRVFNTMASSAISNVNIVDNPDVLKLDKVKKANAKSKFSQKIVTHYKTQSLINLHPEIKDSVGNPVVYELPPEAVIPIYTPGTPTDHIGYFILLNEFGNPLDLSEDLKEDSLNSGAGRPDTTAFYKAMGLDSFFGNNHSGRVERDALMSNIYQTLIESHLKSRLNDSGLDNTYIGAPEAVYRCLFSRYLAARKTKLLFVPKDFMTYFCFQYNKDGTGRSQLENIKFTLSLKVTLLICRMMASMNSAINRKTISIQLDEKMGDPVQYIELLQKEAIDKAIVNFTYNPADITRTLAQRAISVKARGIPGAENLDISTEANEVRNIKPDESLAADIDNMMILGLDVPPSAMNMLSENEFSRSVATNNLFFSRRILSKQIIVCGHTENYVKSYVGMSAVLKKKIKDILQQTDKTDKEVSDDKGTADTKEIKNSAIFNDVIKNIKATLPAPDVAPNKTEFDELDAMIQAMTTALDAVFDNDLSSDDPVAIIRAITKSDMVKQLMSRMGVSKDLTISELDPSFIERCMNFRQQLANIAQGVKDIKEKTTPPTGDTSSDDTSTGGAPPF